MYPMYDYNCGLSPYGYGSFGISPFSVTTPITPPAHPEVAPYVSTHKEEGVNSSALLLTSAALASVATAVLLIRKGRANKLIEGTKTTVEKCLANATEKGEKIIADAEDIARSKVTAAHSERDMILRRGNEDLEKMKTEAEQKAQAKVTEADKYVQKVTGEIDKLKQQAEASQQRAEQVHKETLEAIKSLKEGSPKNPTRIPGSGNSTMQLNSSDIEPLTSTENAVADILPRALSAKELSAKSMEFSKLGETAHRAGDYQKAIEHYEEAIRFNPQNLTAYINKGRCCEILGSNLENITEANALFQKSFETRLEAVKKCPNEPLSWESLGRCHRFGIGTKPNPQEELKCMEQIVTLTNGKDDKALNRLGELSKNQVVALSSFERALKANSQNADAMYNLALLLEDGTATKGGKDSVRIFNLYKKALVTYLPDAKGNNEIIGKLKLLNEKLDKSAHKALFGKATNKLSSEERKIKKLLESDEVKNLLESSRRITGESSSSVVTSIPTAAIASTPTPAPASSQPPQPLMSRSLEFGDTIPNPPKADTQAATNVRPGNGNASNAGENLNNTPAPTGTGNGTDAGKNASVGNNAGAAASQPATTAVSPQSAVVAEKDAKDATTLRVEDPRAVIPKGGSIIGTIKIIRNSQIKP